MRFQETQVLTSGISAEYGRFSGGVINAGYQERWQQVFRQLPAEPRGSDLEHYHAV
jgi:hypothetical protein